MKKIINKPETLVREMGRGLTLAHPELEFDSKYKIVKQKQRNQDKVTLISGGGSGHEPAHAGFVGRGMLDVAVCGDVFASPSQIQVYQAIKASAGSKGVLLIIKNYSGDMMNFKNAAHLAAEDGIQVDYVKVDDDIAVEDSLYTVGRRGVAGTVLVHKIAGAAAEAGLELAEVKAAAQKAIERTRTIGFALTSCTVPAKGTPTFELGEDEIEYGVGIHGEPGIRREKIASADELARKMVDDLYRDMNLDGGSGKEELAVLVNGFGASPLQELYVLANAVVREIRGRGQSIFKLFAGNYMTSIDMAGASVTLMRLDEELKRYLEAECDTPALQVRGPFAPLPLEAETDGAEQREPSFRCETDPADAEVGNDAFTLRNIIYLTDKMSEIIIENEVAFCELDAHAGDGDFGMSVAKGFKQLKREWPEIIEHHAGTIGGFLEACSLVIMEHCGGASGPIWGSAFRAAGRYAGDRTALSAAEFAAMMQAAVEGIQATGERSFGRGAVVGDKTLIDALVPFADSWARSAAAGDDLKSAAAKAAEAAAEGAKRTETIVARMGRAGAVGERSLGYPDAGAYALGVIFTELARAMR